MQVNAGQIAPPEAWAFAAGERMMTAAPIETATETGAMRRFSKPAIVLAVAAVIGLIGVARAIASSCVNPAYVQIRIARGAYCWTYEGRGTHFTGWFRGGQRLQVQMSGLAYSGSPSGTTSANWAPRDISVTAPGGIFVPDNAAPGTFDGILSASGNYEISFGPCYMWHNLGRVVICAR